MRTITLQNWQHRGSDGFLSLTSSILSVLAGYHTVMDRITHIIRTIMTHVDALVLQFSIHSTTMDAVTIFYNAGTQVEIAFINLTNPSPMTADSLNIAVDAAVSAYATGQSYIVDNIIHTFDPVVAYELKNAPQAAIADCPADATTNYNVVTTLLGALTGAVNTANTKQNAIAVQLNSLFSELRTLKIIAP